MNYAVWDTELAEGNLMKTSQSDLENSSYPDYQWTIRGDADQQFGNGFSSEGEKALLEMKDEALLQSFPRSGLFPPVMKITHLS